MFYTYAMVILLFCVYLYLLEYTKKKEYIKKIKQLEEIQTVIQNKIVEAEKLNAETTVVLLDKHNQAIKDQIKKIKEKVK